MKKNFLLASVAILSLGMINQSRADIIASGDDCAAEGSTCHWEIDSNGKLTITGSGAMKTNFGTKREDNSKVDSGATTNASWGDYHSTITGIEIGEGITDTGARSFQGLASVKSVSIPTSLTTIGAFAFDRQPDLVNFNVPDGSKLTNFSGNGAFQFSSSLTNESAQKVLDTMAANNKNNETMFDIPVNTFNKSNLTSITIPEGVNEIGTQAF